MDKRNDQSRVKETPGMASQSFVNISWRFSPPSSPSSLFPSVEGSFVIEDSKWKVICQEQQLLLFNEIEDLLTDGCCWCFFSVHFSYFLVFVSSVFDPIPLDSTSLQLSNRKQCNEMPCNARIVRANNFLERKPSPDENKEDACLLKMYYTSLWKRVDLLHVTLQCITLFANKWRSISEFALSTWQSPFVTAIDTITRLALQEVCFSCGQGSGSLDSSFVHLK